MFSRLVSTRSAASPCLAVCLFVCLSVFLAKEGRTRLEATTLAQSRGGSQGYTLDQWNCNYFGGVPCFMPGARCVTCSQPTFTGAGPVTSASGYNKNDQTIPGCGSPSQGLCDSALVCDTVGPGGTCTQPHYMTAQ